MTDRPIARSIHPFNSQSLIHSHPSIHPTNSQSTNHSFVHPSIQWPINQSLNQSIRPSIRPCIHQPNNREIDQSNEIKGNDTPTHPTMLQSNSLFIHRSIHPSNSQSINQSNEIHLSNHLCNHASTHLSTHPSLPPALPPTIHPSFSQSFSQCGYIRVRIGVGGHASGVVGVAGCRLTDATPRFSSFLQVVGRRLKQSNNSAIGFFAVSYTHLTLPTRRTV